MDDKSQAKLELKEAYTKLQEVYKQKGWEDHELQEKVDEVYKEHVWQPPNKRASKCGVLFNVFLVLFICWLGAGAVFTHNRRLGKRFKDAIFDSELSYNWLRLTRLISLPLHKMYDLTQYHSNECFIKNPFYKPEEAPCDYCMAIPKIYPVSYKDANITDQINDQEPVLIHDAPGYATAELGFASLQALWKEHGEALDHGTCQVIRENCEFKSPSELFQLTEQDVTERNISFSWKNCLAESTRYYRQLFAKPAYVDKSSEVFLEKWLFMLQPNQQVHLPAGLNGQNSFLAQLSGTSKFWMHATDNCQGNCTESPLSTPVNKGQIVNFPLNSWRVSFQATGDTLSVMYVSTYS